MVAFTSVVESAVGVSSFLGALRWRASVRRVVSLSRPIRSLDVLRGPGEVLVADDRTLVDACILREGSCLEFFAGGRPTLPYVSTSHETVICWPRGSSL